MDAWKKTLADRKHSERDLVDVEKVLFSSEIFSAVLKINVYVR